MTLPFRYRFPADPVCPPVRAFIATVCTDPLMIEAGSTLIFQVFERRHRLACDHCRTYGAEHPQVES